MNARNVLRQILLILLIVSSGAVIAQGRFTVNGRMKVEAGDLAGARAVVYKNGVKERTLTSNLSKFSLDLELNANYIISFEKDGFVSKKLSFDTRVPSDAAPNGFTPFDFAVSLFKQYDDINMVVFNQPVGMIRYDNAAGDFDYDTDYTKSIQSQLQEAVVKVEKRQKEEQQSAANEAKAKAEAAKAEAKAKAEADKQAAAQAAAEAKAKAEAEKQVAAEAKARSEQDRQVAAQAKAEQAKQEAARKEEERQRAQQAVKEEPKPAPPPSPVQDKPKPQPTPPPVPQRNALASKAQEGQDERRTIEPVLVEEPSRMAPARINESTEARPAVTKEEPIINRTEDLIVESGKVTTVVQLESNGVVTEYRRVFHKWGGTFFFKDGSACSQTEYDQVTRQEQLAGASPRGKLD